MTELGLNTQARALNSFSMWTPETFFRDTLYYAGSLIKCWSLPYVDYDNELTTIEKSIPLNYTAAP